MRCINAWKTREAKRADGPAPRRRKVLLWGVGCALGLSGPSASGQAPDDPFLDPAARRLVEGAQAAWKSAASALDSYTARIHGQQRWRIVATRRNYVMQELRYAARLRWARRQAAVVRLDGYWVRHSALASEITAQAVAEHVGRLGGRHPSGDPFRFARSMLPEGAESADESGFVSPLDAGAEPFYRYRSGDTTTVLLPNGDAVRAVEVVAMPRYRAARFVAAILWIEADSHAVVRLAFRPGKPLDRELAFCVACPDGSRLGARVDLQGPEAARDDSARAARPGFFGRLANAALNSALPRFEIAVASVVVDYGLWNSRHWLPRSMTWLGHAAAYDEAVANENVPDVAVEVSSQLAFEIGDVREAGTDAETTAQVVDRWRELGDSVFGGDRAEGPSGDPGDAAHIVPGESGASVSTPGELFIPAAWDADAFAPGGEAQRHASQLAAVPVGGAPADGQAESGLEASPWTFEPPFLTLRLLDYNSTEGFSAGTRLWRRYSRGRAVLSARWARTPGRVEVRLAAEREFPRLLLGVSAYRDSRPVGWVREFGALQPDETVGWYTADGIGARLSPARRRRESVSLRVFAERHDEFGADLSRETLWGASAHWSPWWGEGSDRRLRGGGELSLRGTLEDDPGTPGRDSSLRAAATAAVLAELGRCAEACTGRGPTLGLEGGLARTWGTMRRADLWLLDETGQGLRGHEPLRAAGRSLLRARADLQQRVWFARLSVFADWLRVGDLDLCAAGAGVVLPAGVRIDAARPVGGGGACSQASSDWRFHLRFDPVF